MAAELKRLEQESLREAGRLRELGQLDVADQYTLRAARYADDAKFFEEQDLQRFPREVSDFEVHGKLPGLQRTRVLFNSQPGKTKTLPNIDPKTTARIQRLIEADLDLQMLPAVRNRLPKATTETILIALDMFDQWLDEDMTYVELAEKYRERIGVSIAQTLLGYAARILGEQYYYGFHENVAMFPNRQHAPNWREVQALKLAAPDAITPTTAEMSGVETSTRDIEQPLEDAEKVGVEPSAPVVTGVSEDVSFADEIDLFNDEPETPAEDTQEAEDERLENSLLSAEVIWPNAISHPLLAEISGEERAFLEENPPSETFEALLQGYKYFTLLLRRDLHGEGRYFPQMVVAGSIESLLKNLKSFGDDDMSARVKEASRKSEFGTYGSWRVGEEVVEFVYLNCNGMRMALDSDTLFPDFGPLTSAEIERRIETALTREAQMRGEPFTEEYLRTLIKQFRANERLSSPASKE